MSGLMWKMNFNAYVWQLAGFARFFLAGINEISDISIFLLFTDTI
jgi:hypothetical protein